MNSPAPEQPLQLGFDALLKNAASDNALRQQERAYAHFPGTMEDALPFYRDLIERHHAAMIGGDADTVLRLRNDAHDLACKLNNYEPGIIADDASPGCVLDAVTRAEDGAVPLWGQSGSFIITIDSMRVRIEMDGLFGVGASCMSWIGFAAHAVDWTKPFLSGTGYRSFLGVGGALAAGYTPDMFAASIISAHVSKELKGQLRLIGRQYQP